MWGLSFLTDFEGSLGYIAAQYSSAWLQGVRIDIPGRQHEQYICLLMSLFSSHAIGPML
jgi:hypothetical protein